jgi:hypothetical protein
LETGVSHLGEFEIGDKVSFDDAVENTNV